MDLVEKTHFDEALQRRSARAAVIVLTLDAESHLPAIFSAIKALDRAPGKVLFIDSSSKDRTNQLILDAGYDVHVIRRDEFGHGRTRNLAAQLCAGFEYLVYLTQDAIPQGAKWLTQLLSPFSTREVALVYGRQLPRPSAALSERFAREFNYPAHSDQSNLADIARRGVKAIFCSNSFAAYRSSALAEAGGFPERLPMGEDMAVALRLLQRGYARFYEADACAIHSHSYSVFQEFKRYFDIGTLMRLDSELGRARVAASGEGLRFLRGELSSAGGVMRPFASGNVLVRTAAKYLGFSFGQIYAVFPPSWRRQMSMHSYFWRG